MSAAHPTSRFLRALTQYGINALGSLGDAGYREGQLACVSEGWSLMELARNAEVSRPTLAGIMGGQRVRPRTVFKLSDALRRGESPRDAHRC